MVIGELGEDDAMVDAGRCIMRRGFLGGGRGMGGSACFVCSYRSATRLLSSRKGASRADGLDLWRTLATFWGAILPLPRLQQLRHSLLVVPMSKTGSWCYMVVPTVLTLKVLTLKVSAGLAKLVKEDRSRPGKKKQVPRTAMNCGKVGNGLKHL